MKQVVERRLDFLKLEGLGLSLCEIVKQLSVKYRKSERTIYYDAETRETWQPLFTQLFDLDKARLVVVNRYERIYREAAFELLKGEDRLGALREMRETTAALVKILGLETVQASEDQAKRVEANDKLVKMFEQKMLESHVVREA